MTDAAAVIRQVLTDGELEHEEPSPGVFDVVLPGERKLKTPVRLEVGAHALSVHAFVCRKPDENFEAVYRWMLERNMKLFGMAFALDAVGDIFLDARLPLSVVSPDEVDRLLGSVLSYADESFNVLLELGFASSIRKEWEWRIANGESTANLEAFRGWLEAGQAAD
ncbi:YbjN domain-containing protein [Nocardioides marmorisolisilvae]|uniref:YbjN domain-containing protein n=1 Tax=Nocardioides marmorisolisilvae TaxID=1542737 RepID=A0A3N0DPR2_9ACTN|nr:YbjN domain-containing protein [Nocardioides marmorisolisilvae]RNL77471.1 YbjN domain-containing protein [Nocardioides marmorisolisilvae]